MFRFADARTLVSDTLEAWYRHNAPRLGAALAFYTVLSLAPLLIVVITVASLISGRTAAEGQFVWQIQDLTGREGAEVIRQMMVGARQPANGILDTALGLLTLFLGATAVVAELRDALNTVWEVPSQSQESQWPRSVVRILKQRAFSFVMVLGVGFLLLVSLIVNVWLAAAGALFSEWLPVPEPALQSLTSVVSFVVINVLFALIYKFLPDVDLEWWDVAAGAALTSLLFSLGKLGIGVYLAKTGLGSTYGPQAHWWFCWCGSTIRRRSSSSALYSRMFTHAVAAAAQVPGPAKDFWADWFLTARGHMTI